MAGHIGPIDTYVPISDFFSFVDYFSVARIDGRWQITNKTLPTPGASRPLSDRPRAAQGRSPARCHNAVG
jgi:hypothetical protein